MDYKLNYLVLLVCDGSTKVSNAEIKCCNYMNGYTMSLNFHRQLNKFKMDPF